VLVVEPFVTPDLVAELAQTVQRLTHRTS
jgi:hypothetical protein